MMNPGSCLRGDTSYPATRWPHCTQLRLLKTCRIGRPFSDRSFRGTSGAKNRGGMSIKREGGERAGSEDGALATVEYMRSMYASTNATVHAVALGARCTLLLHRHWQIKCTTSRHASLPSTLTQSAFLGRFVRCLSDNVLGVARQSCIYDEQWVAHHAAYAEDPRNLDQKQPT